MVDRNPYVSNTNGAPPLPPPGGYRGSSRAAQVTSYRDAALAERVETATIERSRHKFHWAGWIALSTAVLFALVLGGIALTGTSNTLFSTTVFVVQLLVIAAVIAALAIKRARTLGIAALTIALLVNVATVGSASALQVASSGSYVHERSPAQQHEHAFPGVEGHEADEILLQPSLEEEREKIAELFQAVRGELSREYGVTWTQVTDESTRHMRNGRGGESMLYTASFAGWMTNEPIHDLDLKYAMFGTAADVVWAHGFDIPYAFNLDDGTIPPSQMENLYGGLVPEEQVLWSQATWEGWSTPTVVYLDLLDLSRDTTGDFTRGAEGSRARPGDPIEGFRLAAISEPLLKQADRAEFVERMRDY